VIEAGLWGGIAASFLLIGALLAFFVDLPRRVVGLILAFGAGTLMSAVAYELVEEAAHNSINGIDVGVGFGGGAIVFFVGSVLIDRIGGGDAAADDGMTSSRNRGKGLALVLGSVLDGLPESIVLGLSFVPGVGVTLPVLVAIAVSNLPEGLSATEDLSASGQSRGRIIRLWVLVVVASAVAAAIGYGILGPMGPRIGVLLQAFAAGAIVAMLAESMIPEAHETGGRAVGLATALGFAVAAALSLNP
jgi:ZIP family zinc transporter